MTFPVLLAIDQGTTGTRAILYHPSGKGIASAYQEFRQYYPHPGWVEHNAEEIWQCTLHVIAKALRASGQKALQIHAIGITNQRETVIVWDKNTGRPVHPAIVWQDRRTAALCSVLKKKGQEKIFRRKTGLVLDPYFSGTKVKWLFDHVPGLRRKAQQGRILFGTIDTWLLWKLSGGKVHATDYTNASRTLLFNIHSKKWDAELLKLLKIPEGILPRVEKSSALFGETAKGQSLPSGIPIHALLGDQQAALYGQACYKKGEIKNTYGTGCFLMINLGQQKAEVPFGLLETLACDKEGNPVYALEGSIFIAGASIQWLRDGLKFFKKSSESEALARRVKDSGGVVVIPAFAGLGSPYWRADVRGVISGLTRGSTREHIIYATLESLAHQTVDVLDFIHSQAGVKIHELKVDGGATRNRLLMQMQADLAQIPVEVSSVSESTAWGVAKLAGFASGFWPSLDSLDRKVAYTRFRPKLKSPQVIEKRRLWKSEVKKLLYKS